MTREELIEKVAEALCLAADMDADDADMTYMRQSAIDAIDIVLEEAAKVAEGYWWDLEAHPLSLSAEQAKNTAKAIRALKATEGGT